MENNRKTTDLGAIIGIIIVVIILLVGALYFAQQRIEKQKEFQASLSSTSDEVADIESSANSMNFDSLGTGIDNL